jgi:putative membrane protein
MRSTTAGSTTVVMLGLGLLLITACTPKSDGTDAARRTSADRGTSQMASADTNEVPVPPPTAAPLTDANIMALLDEANQADSAAGAFVVGRATNADVKAYARMMMSEHHGLRAQGQQLAKRIGVTPAPPADDPLRAAAQSAMATLQATPKGAQFDRTYIDQEITMHQQVIDLAEQSHHSAQHAEIKQLIEQARPVLQKHLARAKEIQGKLSSGTT